MPLALDGIDSEMAELRRRAVIVIAITAMVAASIGAGTTYVLMSVTSSPTPVALNGSFQDVQTGVGWSSGCQPGSCYAPATVNATLELASPAALDPAGLLVSFIGPNGTVKTPNGSVSDLIMSYLPGWPHWEPQFCYGGGNWPGPTCYYWADYGVSFTDPGGAVVGGDEFTNATSAATIEPGAIMSAWVPGNYYNYSITGFTIELMYSGHPGSLALSIS